MSPAQLVAKALAVAARAHQVPLDAVSTPRRGGLPRGSIDRARDDGIYLAVVAGNTPKLHVAAAAGVTRAAIMRACNRVEDARDDAGVDARLTRLEQEIAA